ncbi:MAG: ATPase [Oscillospiraceae bacterium]|nr:ATPase [Oscillospiraceae bacterium]
MNIETILDMMGDVLDKAVAMPLSGRRSLIDVEKMSNLLNDIHANLPREIAKAREVVNERKALLAEARREADELLKKAEERAKTLVAQQEITRTAQARAEEIMLDAHQKARTLRNATNHYIEDMLANSDEMLTKNLAAIKKARAALKNSAR